MEVAPMLVCELNLSRDASDEKFLLQSTDLR